MSSAAAAATELEARGQVAAAEAVALPGRAGCWDVFVAGDRVTDVRRSEATHPPRALALPAFAEPHLHLDCAFMEPPRPSCSLEEAGAVLDGLREGLSDEAVRAGMRRLLERAAQHGVTSVRAHVDVEPDLGLRFVRAAREAAASIRWAMEVELVAFATRACDPASLAGRRLLEGALAAGADHLGGIPWQYRDAARSITALLSAASAAGTELDLHVDETTDPRLSVLPTLTALALEHGFVGRLTAGHCCSLPALPASTRRRVLRDLVELRATVCVQPATNLYLQDRSPHRTPRKRGLTLVRELLDAGVRVLFGSDNVRDPYFPYGDADPLQSALLASIAAHVSDQGDLLGGIAGGRRTIEAGDGADIVLLPAESFVDALARRPPGRRVIRSGCLLEVPESAPRDPDPVEAALHVSPSDPAHSAPDHPARGR